MKRNTRNTLLAICCSAAMLAGIGCSSDGEMSIDGFYQARSGSLAGDECDDLLVAAAEADGDQQEELKGQYRECIEEAIAEQGGEAEAHENDATCDIILDEIGDAIDRIRAERDHNEAPNCEAPASNGDEALCHLMDAYEVCQLDHDGDGDTDVDRLPAEACEREAAAAETEADRDEFLDEHPECGEEGGGDGGESSGEEGSGEHGEDGREGTDRDGDEASAGGGEGAEGEGGIGDKTCDTIRELHANVGAEDREFLERERPDCFGEDGGSEGGESGTGGESGESAEGEGSTEGGEGDVDAFCAELEAQIRDAETDQKRADLQEIFERECTP